MTVMQLVEDIVTAIDKNKFTVVGVYTLKKAFDKIGQNVLLDKLERFGLWE